MSAFSSLDAERMARALYLAARSRNGCDPNPRVGCVIDAAGALVGEGWHKRAGTAHAEVIALQNAGQRARGATAYVTLEPCHHDGRTGPCTRHLIDAGIARVVYASDDANPLAAGGGAALRAAGIVVERGLMAAEAQAINRGFFKRMRTGRPFVLSKVASSLDGRTALANGVSKWITSPAARADVQRLRSQASAVVTGIGTVLADDPRLTVRLDPHESWQAPARIVVDSHLRTPPDARLFAGPGPVVIATLEPGDSPAARALAAKGAQIETLPAEGGRVAIVALLDALGRLAYNELLVEAGAQLNGALLAAGAIDELVVYQAPVVLGDDARGMFAFGPLETMAERPGFELLSLRRMGCDWRLRLRPGSL